MVLERPAVNQRGGNMGASDSISRPMPRWNEHKLAQLAAEVDDQDFQRRSSRLDQWRELSRQAAQERNCEVPFPDQIEWLVLHPMCWSFVFFGKLFWATSESCSSLLGWVSGALRQSNAVYFAGEWSIVMPHLRHIHKHFQKNDYIELYRIIINCIYIHIFLNINTWLLYATNYY